MSAPPDLVVRRVVTLGGIGDLPIAPGTWGSLAAIPLAWGLHALGGFPLLASATVIVFLLGHSAVRLYLDGRKEDPSEVVIDELVGMWIALWPLSFGMGMVAGRPIVPEGIVWAAWMPQPASWPVIAAWDFPWPGWVLGFLLFRFFDIVKPPPVSWVDRRKTPLGVMLDDVVAGVLSAILAILAAGLAHGWFG